MARALFSSRGSKHQQETRFFRNTRGCNFSKGCVRPVMRAIADHLKYYNTVKGSARSLGFCYVDNGISRGFQRNASDVKKRWLLTLSRGRTPCTWPYTCMETHQISCLLLLPPYKSIFVSHYQGRPDNWAEKSKYKSCHFGNAYCYYCLSIVYFFFSRLIL